jgi:hypothetical protein
MTDSTIEGQHGQNPAILVGSRVHLRSDFPRPWTETSEVTCFNGVPCTWEVTALHAAYEFAGTGGTHRVSPRATIRPVGPPGPAMSVPLARLVLPDDRDQEKEKRT